MCGRVAYISYWLISAASDTLFDSGCAFAFLSAHLDQQSGCLHCEQLDFQIDITIIVKIRGGHV